ncbi:hypothetical protein EFW17_15340 [Halostreptopolyspora alba]|uniref:Uncharacterized protein n=1 Tax=Halostreptopolyspora alba TaxID=2487137 RepID=A0A3N0E6Y9_9ACTN|nr:hypothetical protein EFW17_15340 [Nocardiopsaceae bacterium YIM 96095]
MAGVPEQRDSSRSSPWTVGNRLCDAVPASKREGPMPRNSEPPPCGRCGGTGKLTYQRPKRGADGTVVFVDSVEDCDSCGGTGVCA